MVCIIGPSGLGKSTLIRCINRLEDFSRDSKIRVDGTPVTGRGTGRRHPPHPEWCITIPWITVDRLTEALTAILARQAA